MLQAAGVCLAVLVGCGNPEHFYLRENETDGDAMGGADAGSPDVVSSSGGAVATGTGGAPGSGGTASGGNTGSGGRASGGATQTGGAGAGQSGGSPATGGMTATGGAGTGGAPATGGRGTGGAATGGAGTGGAATGGTGTGGAGTGGAAPTRLLLSIDFVGGRSSAATAMSAYETAGARPAMHWNSAQGAMGSLASLSLSDGTTSNATVTWNALQSGATMGMWTINYADQAGDLRMLNGYLDPTWPSIPSTASTLVTVSGLPASIASGSYDVYIYTVGDTGSDMRSYQYGLGSQVQTVQQNSAPPVSPPSPFPYASANDSMTGTHVVFTSITGASFSVTAKPISGTNSRYRAPVNGIQIVWPAGS